MARKYTPRQSTESVKREVAVDYNSFYSFLDVVRGLVPSERPVLVPERKLAYDKMVALSERYSSDNTLKNKIDEAERILWPNGRR